MIVKLFIGKKIYALVNAMLLAIGKTKIQKNRAKL